MSEAVGSSEAFSLQVSKFEDLSRPLSLSLFGASGCSIYGIINIYICTQLNICAGQPTSQPSTQSPYGPLKSLHPWHRCFHCHFLPQPCPRWRASIGPKESGRCSMMPRKKTQSIEHAKTLHYSDILLASTNISTS